MFNTLAYFPTPGYDEDFRSLIYRYRVRSPHQSLKSTMKKLFDLSSQQVTILPQNLNHLFTYMSAEDKTSALMEFINGHTLFPLFAPFLDDAQNKFIIKRMKQFKKDSNRGAAHFTPRIIYELTHYCPKCLTEDYETFGTCYVHRMHQVKGVHICATHKAPLITHCPECEVELADSRNNRLLGQPVCSNGHNLDVSDRVSNLPERINSLQAQVALDVKYLLDHAGQLKREAIRKKLLYWAERNGYLISLWVYSKRDFYEDLMRVYPIENLEGVDITTSYWCQKTARSLFHIEGKINPIFYLVLMQFFAGSTEEFLTGRSYAI